MKTKFKEFVKKIKNWLSSLSKWAQKNKLKLFALFCLTFLLFGNLKICSNNKKSASAQMLTGDKPLIMMPTIPLYNSSNRNDAGYIPSFYISELDNSYIFYYAVAGATASLDYSGPHLVATNTPFVYTPYYVLLTESGLVVREMIATGGTTITLALPSYDTLAQSCSYVGFECLGAVINYYFFDATRSTIGQITISNISLPSNVTYSDYDSFVFTTIASGVDLTYATTQSYAMGVNQGFINGYDNGYNTGYNEGLVAQGLDFTPFGVIVNSVNGLLQINLFGNVSIADVLSMSFGIILLGFVIKIFLGG